MLGVYAVALVWLAGLLPLWLDEVLTLIGAAKPTLHGLIEWVGYNPGSSPLGFLVQRPFIEALGLTRLAARLPSILFSVLSAAALIGFAKDLDARARTLLLGVYLILPIQLRYAVEARPYAAALLFTIAALWCLWRLLERPDWRLTAAYAVLVAAAMYAQPFAVFVQAGALAALAFSSKPRGVTQAACGLALGCLLFAPWYLHVREAWKQEIVTSGYTAAVNARSALMLVREIAGGGYWQSIPLLLAACLGWKETPQRVRRFLLGGIAAGIIGAMAADAVSGYFFATRHVLFAIPALVTLAAAGFASPRYRRAGAALAGIFFIASIAKSAGYFHSGTEDWPGAARVILAEAQKGSCIIVTPPEPEDLYTLFEPELREHLCRAESAIGHVAVVESRYTIPGRLEQTKAGLTSRGFRQVGASALPGEVRLELFQPPQ